jgi:predicted ATP-grasp superfamily ATP-dependent carboligase
MSEASAVLVGDDDMVRALGLAGLSCLLVALPDNAARWSRFVTGLLDVRRADLADALVAYAERRPEPPALFLQEDSALLFADRHRDRLERAFRLSLPPRELLADLLDKPRFQALAGRLDLPVPRAVAVNGTVPEEQLARLRTPLLVKPALRDDAWLASTGGAKALAVTDRAAWERMYPKLARLGGQLLVQEQVPGGEERIESYHAYVAADGETRGEFTGRKLRTWPARFGGSTALVTTDAPDLRELGRDTVARLGLRGALKADFKRGPDGELWLLEVNPRFTLWAHLGAVAGVNLPALAYAEMAGRGARRAGPARAGVSWCHPALDAAAVRAEGGSMRRWAGFALRCDARSGAQLDDPMPLLAGKLWPRLVHRS